MSVADAYRMLSVGFIAALCEAFVAYMHYIHGLFVYIRYVSLGAMCAEASGQQNKAGSRSDSSRAHQTQNQVFARPISWSCCGFAHMQNTYVYMYIV